LSDRKKISHRQCIAAADDDKLSSAAVARRVKKVVGSGTDKNVGHSSTTSTER